MSKEISHVQGEKRAAYGFSSQEKKEGVSHRESYGSSVKVKTGYGMGSSLLDIQGTRSQTEEKQEDRYVTRDATKYRHSSGQFKTITGLFLLSDSTGRYNEHLSSR